MASSSNEMREAQNAIAYYEKTGDAKYQNVVFSSLKAMIVNLNSEDQGSQERFVRPVQSIHLVGILNKSECMPIQSNEVVGHSPTPQSEVDWSILEKIFDRVNNIWIEKCKGFVC